MTCPQCRVVGSRFSDLCTECGAQLNSEAATEKVREPLASELLPPRVPFNETLLTTADYRGMHGTSSIAVGSRSKVRYQRQWKLPALVCVLGLAALAGTGIRWLKAARQPIDMYPLAQPVSSRDFAPTVSTVSAPASGIETLQDAEDRERTALATDTEREVEPPPTGLHPAASANVPFPAYTPSLRPLTLKNRAPVPPQVSAQVNEAYRKWKWRLSEKSNTVERIFNIYASDAQIFCSPTKKISRDELRPMLIELRQGGYFTSVVDQKGLQWTQDKGGKAIELLAYHRYSDDAGNLLWGQRRLVWQKRSGEWLIIRDDLPPCYFSE